jgi:hypothetical protein
MVKRYKIGGETQLKGMRLMEGSDVKRVTELLKGFLEKFDLAPVYEEDEVEHWFLHKGDDETRVIWTYVVEVPSQLCQKLILGSIDQGDYGFHFVLFSSIYSVE